MGRRILGITLVAAALAAVPWRLGSERDRVAGISGAFDGAGAVSRLAGTPSEAWLNGEPYPADWVLFPPKDDVPFPRDAAAFAAFTAALPPKLARADLWAWWRQDGLLLPSPRYGKDSRYERNGQYNEARGEFDLVPYEPNEREAAEYRRQDELRDAVAAFLRERDPDNGWPLALMALRELREATREIEFDNPKAAEDSRAAKKITRWRVEDPARAAKAAQLLHEAVRRPRFDQALDELTMADFTRYGGRPAALPETIRLVGVLAGYDLPHMQLLRDIARRMGGEVERRAALIGLDDGLDAADVARDVQTMALRSMAHTPSLIECLVANAVVAIASEDGDRALRAAGREAEAVDLANRGRRIAWLYVVNRAMEGVRERREAAANPAAARSSFRPSFLDNDPAMIAEAERLLDDPAERERRGEEGEYPYWQMGMLGQMLAPALARAAYAPEIRPTPQAIRDSARFEYYGFARVIALGGLGGWWLFLIGWTLLAIAVAVAGWIKRPAGRDVGWPGVGWIAGASAAFALPAFGAPFLMAYFPGSFLAQWMPPAMEDFPLDLGTPITGFWLAWGALAGWNAVVWLADRATRRAAVAGDAADAVCPRWHSDSILRGRRGIWLGLLLAPVVAMAGWGVTGFGEGFSVVIGAAFLLLLPAGLAVLFHAVAMAGGTPTRTLGRARGRRMLVGLAGGVLCGLAGFAWLGGLEARAAARETLIIPDDMGGYVTMTPLEGRLVAAYRRHARRLLAEEGIELSKNVGE